MDVDATELRCIECGRRQNEAVCGDHQDIQGAQAVHFVADAPWRVHGDAAAFRAYPHGAWRRPAAASRGAVRLREDGRYDMRRVDEPFQDSNGEVGGAGETQSQGAAQTLSASSRCCLASFLRMRLRFRFDR